MAFAGRDTRCPGFYVDISFNWNNVFSLNQCGCVTVKIEGWNGGHPLNTFLKVLISIAFFRINMLQMRKLEGCWCRVPNRFYNQVWDILRRTPKGIRVRNQVLPQQPTINNMSHSELQFALHVENMLNHIEKPEYRQLVVEVSFCLTVVDSNDVCRILWCLCQKPFGVRHLSLKNKIKKLQFEILLCSIKTNKLISMGWNRNKKKVLELEPYLYFNIFITITGIENNIYD